MAILSNIELGLETALTFNNLLFCFLGVLFGTLAGVLPGIGSLTAISMLMPITFYLEPTPAVIMLAGIWYGAAYGGSVASILINIPGTTSSAVTCIDGYPMARQGRGGVALLMTTAGSFVGGSIGIIILMIFAPFIANFALSIGSAEYFALMVFGLVAASSISEGSAIRSIAMIVCGLMFGTVGMDMYTGTLRFDFGVLDLAEGISLVALAMGTFGVAEVIVSVRKVEVGDIDRESVKFRKMIPTRDDLRRSWGPMWRGSFIGSFLGALPGSGASIASFVSYALEKRVAKEPERFGKGAIEGVVGPETANNAADQTSFIPTLSLGIPSSGSMALMLGALIIHGIQPGPSLITEEPALFWGLIMSFWVGNCLLVILNAPLVGIWVRLLLIPYPLLYPSVLMFVCMGAYSIRNNPFDVWMVVFFGIVGYSMRLLRFPAVSLLLGFVLGPLMEEHFRRAMLYSRGDLLTFFSRPLSAIFLAATLLLLVWVNWNRIWGWWKSKRIGEGQV